MEIDFLQPRGVDNFSDLGISFVSGVNEYIDNAIEANAKNIMVILKNNGNSIDLLIIEDGQGMDGETLQYAMSFGGEEAGVKHKQDTDIGKFHAGMTTASLSLSNHTDVFSNNGNGWVKNYLDVEEIKRTKKIYPSEDCELPNEISAVLKDAMREKGLEIELETGTVIVLKNIDKEIIGPHNFDLEVQELFNNSCIRYYDYLTNEGSIYIMVNDAKNIKNCESIHPLLKNDRLLEKNGLEMLANFKYENILTIREVLPYSKIDSSMDIEFVLIRKINKSDRMLEAHDLVKYNMENQGSYLGRNNLNIIRGEKIGYNKKHNSFNGVRTYSNFDAKWDTVLGININKSMCNPNSKFYELLNERLGKIFTHIRAVLNEGKKLNLPTIEMAYGRKCEPQIFKDLTKEEEKANKTNKTNKTNKKEDNPNGRDSGEDSTEHTDNNDPNNDTNTNGNTDNTTSNTDTNNTKNSSKENEAETSIKLDGKVPIIFAAKGKPSLKVNMGNGAVNLSKDDKNYYIYDKEVNSLGVRKVDIEEWCLENRISKDEFYDKLKKSIPEDAETQAKFYEYYMKHIYNDAKKDFFLFPEVYVNVNVKSWDIESKQRIDFMMILPNKEKVIIEIDGIGHYATENKGKWYADSNKYSIDRKFDREMQLQGYKVFRFSNDEIKNDIGVVEKFFKELFR